MIQSRKMRWTGHVKYMEDTSMINGYKILVGKPEGKIQIRKHKRKWEVILKWILRKYGGRCGLDSLDFGQGPVAGSCEHGNEPSDSRRGEQFHE
jgi:hypothetical protein